MKVFKPKTEKEVSKVLHVAMRDPGSNVTRLTPNIVEIYSRGVYTFVNSKNFVIFEIPEDAKALNKGGMYRLSGHTNVEVARKIIKAFCD